MYDDIPSKIPEINVQIEEEGYIPKEDDLYSIDEIYDRLYYRIVDHYYGEYDKYENWNDDSGNAYLIKYSKDGSIESVLRGVFINNKFISGHMYELYDDDLVIYSVGKYREESGNNINV